MVALPNNWKWIISSIFVFLMGLGLVAGLMLVAQNQDVRNQAATNQTVEVQLRQSSNFRTNSRSTVIVSLNTNGQSIDGIQLVFTVRMPQHSNFALRVTPPSGLQKIWDKVEDVPEGKKVSMSLITTNPASPYTASSLRTIAEVSLTPQAPGTISMSFDDGWSKANAHGRIEDILIPVGQKDFSVEGNVVTTTPRATARPTASPRPTATPRATATPRPTATPRGGSTSQSSTPRPTATSQPSVSATAAPSTLETGGCNTACADSLECQGNLFCNDGLCRHPSEPDDENCQLVDPTTDPLAYDFSSEATTQPTTVPTAAPLAENLQTRKSNPILTALKVAAVIAGLIFFGLLGYFGYTWYKERQAQKLNQL